MSQSASSARRDDGRSIAAVLSPQNPDVLVIAHRGVWTDAPENSLAAIRAAIALGLDMVEIDAQSDADGGIVVIHDETMDRTTALAGLVRETPGSLVAGARLRAGPGGAEAALTDERLPTLAQALEEARGRILVNIDTKYARDLDAVTKVALDLRMADEVLIKAEIDPAADRWPVEDMGFYGKLVFMPLMTARHRCFGDDLRRIDRMKAPMVEVHYDAIDSLSAARDELQRQAMRLWVNTLDVSHSLDHCDSRALGDPDAVWGVLTQAGVGAIQTDTAAELVGWLVANGLRKA